MIIETKNLTLVPLTADFLSTAAAYAIGSQHIDMMVYFPMDTIEELNAYLKDNTLQFEKAQPDFLDFAVLYQGKHIGQVTLYFEGLEGSGELGWIIRREYRGRGFAAEAAEGLMQYFHKNYSICRFIAECDSENYASQRVIEKLGMRYLETHGGRKNRSSEEERLEMLYEKCMGGKE